MAGTSGGALARSAQRFRQVEQRFPALPPLGEGRGVRAHLHLLVRRAGLRIRPDRWHHRHRPPEGEWRKGGTQAQAIGRSRGGLTTKIVALPQTGPSPLATTRQIPATPPPFTSPPPSS